MNQDIKRKSIKIKKEIESLMRFCYNDNLLYHYAKEALHSLNKVIIKNEEIEDKKNNK